MKRLCLTALIVMVSTVAFAQAPKLADPIPVKANGEIIDIGGYGYAAPFYADMDGDNVPDLLIGEFEGGELRIYRNHGTAINPVFKDFEYLKVDGDVAVIPPS
ncbi:MAG: hypothetical protein MI702_03285 [Chlorobiales bacterium]|nr:hypothetical protein [Chlorobiales bacterium]